MSIETNKDWEGLRAVWSAQQIAPLTEAVADKSLLAVQAEHAQFRRKLWFRDLREVGAGLIMAAAFSYWAHASVGWAAVGSYAMGGICLGVSSVILWQRLYTRARIRRYPDTVRGGIEAKLWEVNFQLQLLRRVRWWYLGPFALGILFFTGGRALEAQDISSLVGMLLVLPIVWFTYRYIEHLNLKAARDELQPRAAELSALLEDM